MIAAHTIASRLGDRARSSPDAIAVVGQSELVAFGELAARADAAASALHRSGVLREGRFAVLSRNSATIVELMHAASYSETVMVPLNFRLAPREIAEIVQDSGARLVFVEDELLPLLGEPAADVVTVRVAEHATTDEYRAWRGVDRRPAAGRDTRDGGAITGGVASSDRVVLQMYTTGTTGRPKGVMITEGNIAAMVPPVAEVFALDSNSRYLALLPMFHISGGGTPLAVLASGGQVVLPTGTSTDAILRDVATHAITHANLVPSLISMMAADPATRAADLRSLRMLMYGAAPSRSAVITEAMELLPGCAFLHGYGLTECTGGVTFAGPHRCGEESSDPEGSVGRPLPTCELRVVDPRAMVDVAPGAPGEIWVRGPQNTIGYWNRPAETAALFAAGWLRTGDIGAIVDGHLVLKDRLKDMIISGGENVYSAEVENAISSHPAVMEVAVIGVPDERWGEAVKAVAVLRRGWSASPDEIIEFTRGRLAHYKCPKYVDIADELPKSVTGKVLKGALRDSA